LRPSQFVSRQKEIDAINFHMRSTSCCDTAASGFGETER
jgi:hypothetical protein